MPGELKPVLTRAQAVAEELRRLIQLNELPPGTPLRQNDIATRFEVSTTPVREAFRLLAREGFVTDDPHRGVVVFSPSPEDLRENYEIRIVLECLAVELAAMQITDEQLAAVQEACAEMGRAVVAGEVQRYARDLNPRFHELIYATANRPRLADLIATLRNSATAYILALAGNQSSGDVSIAQREHEQIVAALTAHDSEAAVAAMRAHLVHNAGEMLKVVFDGNDGHDGPTSSAMRGVDLNAK